MRDRNDDVRLMLAFAAGLDTSETAVKALVHRARTALAQALAEFDGGARDAALEVAR